MKIFKINLCQFAQSVLPLGIQGENLARSIVVDVGEHSGGYWALNVQNAVGTVYPAAIREENGCVVWSITGGDTAFAGAGKAELVLYGKNGEIIKSAIAKTLVHASLPAPTGDAPDPVQTWLDAAYEALDALQGSTVLPPITPDDNGKVLTAQDGAWVAKAPTGGGVDFEVDETLKLENGILGVNTAKKMEKDNTLPITSAAVYVEVGNINALLETI